MALENRFHHGISRIVARRLVEHAVRAPSSHNTQPWRFRVRGATIDLFADRTRALPVNDPDDRELTISCGAALMNLRIAAADAGLGVNVQLLPSKDDPDWLARVAPAVLSEGHLGEAVLSRNRTRRDEAPMSTNVGIWIDHKKAIIVSASADGVSTRTSESEVGAHPHFGGQQDGGGEKKYEERHSHRLERYYDEVISQLGEPEG